MSVWGCKRFFRDQRGSASAEWLVAVAVVGLLAVPVVTLVSEGTKDHAQPVADHLSEDSTDAVGGLSENQLAGQGDADGQGSDASGISTEIATLSSSGTGGQNEPAGVSMGVGVPIESGAFRNQLGVDTAPITVRQPATGGPSFGITVEGGGGSIQSEGGQQTVPILRAAPASESKIDVAEEDQAAEETVVADAVIRPDLIDVDLDDGADDNKRSKDKTKDISVGAKNAVKFKF